MEEPMGSSSISESDITNHLLTIEPPYTSDIPWHAPEITTDLTFPTELSSSTSLTSKPGLDQYISAVMSTDKELCANDLDLYKDCVSKPSAHSESTLSIEVTQPVSKHSHEHLQSDQQYKITPPDLLPYDSDQLAILNSVSEPSPEQTLSNSQPPPELLPYDSEQPPNQYLNISDNPSEHASSVFHTPPELLPYDSDQPAVLHTRDSESGIEKLISVNKLSETDTETTTMAVEVGTDPPSLYNYIYNHDPVLEDKHLVEEMLSAPELPMTNLSFDSPNNAILLESLESPLEQLGPASEMRINKQHNTFDAAFCATNHSTEEVISCKSQSNSITKSSETLVSCSPELGSEKPNDVEKQVLLSHSPTDTNPTVLETKDLAAAAAQHIPQPLSFTDCPMIPKQLVSVSEAITDQQLLLSETPLSTEQQLKPCSTSYESNISSDHQDVSVQEHLVLELEHTNKRSRSKSITKWRSSESINKMKRSHSKSQDRKRSRSKSTTRRERSPPKTVDKRERTRSKSITQRKLSRYKSTTKRKRSRSMSVSPKKSSRSKSVKRISRSRSKSIMHKRSSRSKSATSKRRSRSKSATRKRRSRSKSATRKRRSRTRSATSKRRSRSKSATRKRRSCSRSATRKRRSRSRSATRKRRSRSRSATRKRRSRSATRKRRFRSRSATRKRSTRSRSATRKRSTRSKSATSKRISRTPSVTSKRRSHSPSVACKRRSPSAARGWRSRSGSAARGWRSRSGSAARRSRTRSGSAARRRRTRSGSAARRRRTRSGSAAGRRRSRSSSAARRRLSRSVSAIRRRRSRSGSAAHGRRSGSAARGRRSRSGSAARRRRSRSGSAARRRRSCSAAHRRRSLSKSLTPKSPALKICARSKLDRSRSRSQSNLSRKRKTRSRSSSREKNKSSDKRSKRSNSKDHYSIKSRRRSRTPLRWNKSRSPVKRPNLCISPVRRRRSRSPIRRKSFSRSPIRRKRSRSRDVSVDSSRSPKRLTDLDKAQLLEIAKANAAAMCAKAGVPLPPSLKPVTTPVAAIEEKVSSRSYGITIQELTEKCKQIAQSKEDDVIVNKPHDSDEEEEERPFYNHPFKVNDHKPISFSLLNPTVKPAPKNQVTLTKEFPVSSGSQHRKKESDKVYGEWVPVDTKTEESKDDVFTNTGPSQPVDITSAMNERAVAQTRLTGNPFDLEALLMLNRAQEQIDAWAQSTSLPGQFTGSTGAQVLTADEISNSGPQAWLKKDQFLKAAPVSGGMGALLMHKMGWKEGEGLGRHNEGNVNPILVDFKTDRKGLVADGEKATNKVSLPIMKDLSGKHPISALMELCNKKKWPPPEFVLVDDTGPEHRKRFLFRVTVSGGVYQPSQASVNKKLAKATAAAAALQALGALSKESMSSTPNFLSANSSTS